MSTIAVQAPYCHSPYLKPILAGHTSGGDTNGRYPKHLDIRPTSPPKSHRWSPNFNSGDRPAEEKQMSRNGTASGPSPHEGYHWQPPPSASQMFPDHASLNNQLIGRQPKMEDQSSHGSGLPPLKRHLEGGNNSSERRTSRSLGVHSILNPTHTEEPESQPPRRSFAQMEEDFRMGPNPSNSGGLLSRPQSGETSHEGTSPPVGAGGPRVVRRILTPISPRVRRATSFGRPPTGTINAQEMPFLSPSARFHPQEPEMGPLPPMPSHSNQVSQQQSPFLVPAAPTPPLIGPSRRPSVSVVHSTRASPSPSNYSSYSQSGMSAISRKTSPSLPSYPAGSGPTPPGSYHLTPSPVIGPLSNVPPVSLEGEQNYNTMVSSGQNYQLLTIDTTKGHMQLPVEVQAASKMADEKRKRNAGASARFRARRKEKEREASSRISNLEQELAWAQEDSRHYKQERDYLSELLLRHLPQYESYLKERPKSPIHDRDFTRRRHSTHDVSSTGDSASPRTMPGPPPIMPSDRYDQNEGERPAARRRTETFPLVSPAATTPGHRSYQPPSPSFTPFTRTVGHIPNQQQHQQQQQLQSRQPPQLPTANYAPPNQGPPAHSPQLPSIGHEPYRQEHTQERSWPPRPEHQR